MTGYLYRGRMNSLK